MEKGKIQFSVMLVYVGILAGIAIAVLLPYVILVYGSHLSEFATALLIILALLSGGITTLVAVVLGIVIPKKIEESKS
jgi:hypothetical protein